MTAEVVSLHGARVGNERREQFMAQVAASFDDFAEVYGEEPEALMFALCGIRQNVATGWLVTGESEGAGSALMAYAAAALRSEVFKGD